MEGLYPGLVTVNSLLLPLKLISLCALVGIVFIRALRPSIFRKFITFFVSVGVGSLSGSAVFHLLPQAFGLVSEFDPNASHDYLAKSLAAMIGIYLFFFADKAMKIVLETKKMFGVFTAAWNGTLKAHSLCIHDHDMVHKEGDSVIATVAWMIIFGDGLHNLIDGISIGASFSESILSGVSVSAAVLCEEFPHELGDVAILISAGMTIKQALVYNLLSAMSCYVGFVIGVIVGNINEELTSYTFGFAGGMFLYISLACMMPEMKCVLEKALETSLGLGLQVLLLQGLGVFTGMGLMLAMARYGGEISLL